MLLRCFHMDLIIVSRPFDSDMLEVPKGEYGVAAP